MPMSSSPPRRAQARHPRDVRLAHDDHALHEGGHRGVKEKNIRDDYIVTVGGAPLNEEFGEAIGADAYCRCRGRHPDCRALVPVRRLTQVKSDELRG